MSLKLYYALFDNIYRNIQKGIMQRKPQYLEDWKEKQTQASEEMVKELFLKLLPGAESHVRREEVRRAAPLRSGNAGAAPSAEGLLCIPLPLIPGRAAPGCME